jgi:hypothetical protein
MISEEEVERALKKMRSGKAVGPDELSTDMLKALGTPGLKWMTRILRVIWQEQCIPNDWRTSVLVPIFKKKGNIHECSQYRGIKLLCHSLKLLEKVVEARLRIIVEGQLGEEQCGFRPGRGTTDLMFVLRQLLEKNIEVGKDVFLAFLDLEKAYDKVPRAIIWPIMRSYGIPDNLISLVKAMYMDPVTKVRTTYGLTDGFNVAVGLHQGSALSPLIFIMIMDFISKKLPSENFKKLIYADDIVIVAESGAELQQKVSDWYAQLGRYGMKVSLDKTEVLVASSGAAKEARVLLDGKVLKQGTQFKYLGGLIEATGEINEEIKARVKAAAGSWSKVSGVIYDKRMPMVLKAKIYKTVIRPSLLYGAETWAAKVDHIRKLDRMEMRCLRAVTSHSLLEHRTNEYIRREASVRHIKDKIEESRLRWFGHVVRREAGILKEVWEHQVPGIRPRGRPRKRWRDCVTEDMKCKEYILKQAIRCAQDREVWRALVRRPDPIFGTKGG